MIFVCLLKAHTYLHTMELISVPLAVLHQSLGSCSGYAVIPDIYQSSLNERLTQRYLSTQNVGYTRIFGSYCSYILNALRLEVLSLKKKKSRIMVED